MTEFRIFEPSAGWRKTNDRQIRKTRPVQSVPILLSYRSFSINTDLYREICKVGGYEDPPKTGHESINEEHADVVDLRCVCTVRASKVYGGARIVVL